MRAPPRFVTLAASGALTALALSLAAPAARAGDAATAPADRSRDSAAAGAPGADSAAGPTGSAATAEPTGPAAYGRHSFRLGALFGVSTNFDDPYSQVGATFGWSVLRGLELGVDASALLIEAPFIFQLTPGVRYVFVDVPFLQPYVGFLYRRSFIDGDDDLSTMGGRVGVSWDSGEGLSLSGGLAYERAFDCEETRFNGCNGFHPELTISAVF